MQGVVDGREFVVHVIASKSSIKRTHRYAFILSNQWFHEMPSPVLFTLLFGRNFGERILRVSVRGAASHVCWGKMLAPGTAKPFKPNRPGKIATSVTLKIFTSESRDAYFEIHVGVTWGRGEEELYAR